MRAGFKENPGVRAGGCDLRPRGAYCFVYIFCLPAAYIAAVPKTEAKAAGPPCRELHSLGGGGGFSRGDGVLAHLKVRPVPSLQRRPQNGRDFFHRPRAEFLYKQVYRLL